MLKISQRSRLLVTFCNDPRTTTGRVYNELDMFITISNVFITIPNIFRTLWTRPPIRCSVTAPLNRPQKKHFNQINKNPQVQKQTMDFFCVQRLISTCYTMTMTVLNLLHLMCCWSKHRPLSSLNGLVSPSYYPVILLKFSSNLKIYQDK